MKDPQYAATGCEDARRPLTEEEAMCGMLPEPFTEKEWKDAWRKVILLDVMMRNHRLQLSERGST